MRLAIRVLVIVMGLTLILLGLYFLGLIGGVKFLILGKDFQVTDNRLDQTALEIINQGSQLDYLDRTRLTETVTRNVFRGVLVWDTYQRMWLMAKKGITQVSIGPNTKYVISLATKDAGVCEVVENKQLADYVKSGSLEKIDSENWKTYFNLDSGQELFNKLANLGSLLEVETQGDGSLLVKLIQRRCDLLFLSN